MNKLSVAIKAYYGLGFAARGIKDGLFQLFLFFYFSQILGLNAGLAGTAALIALLFDAITDPIIGIISDRWNGGKLGRRHPFMFASALPLGIFTFILFNPPSGLGENQLFLWLLVFSILVRLSLTLFLIPGMSLGAELSTDYEERSSITSYRVAFAAFVSPFIIYFGLLTYFKPVEGMSNGLFNEAAYPKFAMLCGILMIIVILVSTWGTKSMIPFLPSRISQKGKQSAQFKTISSDLFKAIQLKSFQMLMAFVMVINIGIGIGTVFIPYFTTYFFELSEKELALLPMSSAIGGLVSFILVPIFSKFLDKKISSIVSTIIFAVFFSMPFLLRMANIFPDNHSPLLLPSYIFLTSIGYIFLFVVLSFAPSMLADVIDDFDAKTGLREEGLFFSAMSFAYKCTVGLGTFFAGILLNIIDFPTQVEISSIEPDTIANLGWIGGPVLLIVYISAIVFLLFYPIDKNRYHIIREKLNQSG